MPEPVTGFRIEVFRTGTFTPMSGPAVSYSADDLSAIAEGYDPDGSPAPIVIGHPATDAPAYGWVTGFEYDADADRLFAEVGELEPTFAEMVQDGRYKKVSMAFHAPGASSNPNPGSWYPKHVGFLGAAAPAVSGLKPVELAASGEGEEVTFEAAFGEPGFEETADLFRMLRDFFIEKFGRDTADQTLPSYRIEWLGDRELSTTPNTEPSFTAPGADPSSQEEPTMTPEELAAAQAELEAGQAALAADRAVLDADAAQRRTAAHTAFAEKLVTDGKLLPANKTKVIALLDAMPADTAVAFAEGEETPATKALMDLLEDQPNAVSFGETALGDEPEGDMDAAKIASFAAKYQADQAELGIKVSTFEAVEHVKKEQGVDQ